MITDQRVEIIRRRVKKCHVNRVRFDSKRFWWIERTTLASSNRGVIEHKQIDAITRRGWRIEISASAFRCTCQYAARPDN